MTEQQLFISTHANSVIDATKGTSLFPSVKMAQFALESGWGKSIRKAGNNAFGIKAGSSWTGKVISNTTREVLNGVNKVFQGTGELYNSTAEALASGVEKQTLFRYYNTLADSIRDHSRLLLTSSIYAPVRAAKTPQDQARALQSCKYATDPKYAATLISIIKQFNLESLDKKKD